MMARGDKGVNICLNGVTVIDLKNNKELIYASKRGNLYAINGTLNSTSAHSAITNDTWRVWHEWLGHIGQTSLEWMMRNSSVKGLPNCTSLNFFCDNCTANKASQRSFQEWTKWANGILDFIHMDICGPIRTSSHSGKKYFITFIDDYTCKTHVYLLSAKSEAFEKFKEFKVSVESDTKRQIGILRSDNGTEYVKVL